jgi:hypothetical protein
VHLTVFNVCFGEVGLPHDRNLQTARPLHMHRSMLRGVRSQWALRTEASCFSQIDSECRPHERRPIFTLSPHAARRAFDRVNAQIRSLLNQFHFGRLCRLDEADFGDMSAPDILYIEAHGAPRSRG